MNKVSKKDPTFVAFGFYFVLRERIATYLYSKEKRPAEKGEVEEIERMEN